MWQTPKTDWVGTDDFTFSAYVRIAGNLQAIKELADTMYPPTTLPTLPTLTSASYGYAAYINALEDSLDALAATHDPGIPARKTWSGNGTAPMAADINRIEQSCLTLYETLLLQQSALAKLPFELKGSAF